jgi:predicted RNase H-like HicB family nuclease
LNSAGDVESYPVPATAIVAVMLEFSKLSPGDFQKAIKTTVEKHRTLPGCVAAADTLEEVEELIREAMEMQITGLREDGMVPPPTSLTRGIEISG